MSSDIRTKYIQSILFGLKYKSKKINFLNIYKQFEEFILIQVLLLYLIL